jgi:DNA-binding LytR/AlgR family response regulator
MSKINVLIVDDEPLALDVLENYLMRLPSVHIVGRCQHAMEALQVLHTETVDILFLDIQMPQITGIEFLKSITHPPLTIFTTAYPNYAVDSYELNAIDYLLKPISFERFLKAFNKASEQLENKHKQHEIHEESGADYIFVKSDKKLVKIKYADILYIEGLKDYVIIRTTTGRIITLQTMKSLEDKLPSDKFIRIHRSYIVLLDKIEAIDGASIEIDKKLLPIGKNYRDELTELINKNKL